ncbi:ABC transporter ATP-binding protein [Streptomyces sp. NPDC005708]|uniref:ABC transporter ATP-binding protein n=1 Tax=unclassified Streptomyces TaxID=2593676 RepID=UPI0033C02205
MNPAVEIQGLTKSYGSVQALDRVDLTVAAGEMVAVLGANGAGKTTLFETVLGLRRPDAGRVVVLGGTPQQTIAQGRVGAMLQDGALLPKVTVQELLTMVSGWYPDPEPFDQLVERSGISAVLNQRTETLSGGQAQRVRLAMALAGRPALLVLDEPTAAMDPQARRLFWQDQRSVLAGGTAVLFATHYFEEAEAGANRVVVLHHGRIVADASPSALKATAAATSRITFTLTAPDRAGLAALDGVGEVVIDGDRVTLACTDTDAVLRLVVSKYPDARDIEVKGLDIEDAFFALIGGQQ